MELGVAVFVKNHSFRFGTEYSDTLASGASAGATTLTMTNASEEMKALRAEDRILIGPNSSNQQETKVISAVDNNTSTITLDSALTYSYSAGDYVRGTGTALAGGWSVNTNATPSTILPSGRGYDDRYAQEVDLGDSSNPGYIRQSLDDDEMPASTTHRLGCYYKLSGTSPSAYFRANDGASTFISVALSAQSSFTLATGSGASGASPSGSYIEVAHAGGTPTLVLDCVWLEHAKGTDGEPDGYYTFTEVPDLGSVRWQARAFFKRRQLLDGTLRRYNQAGLSDQVRKYIFECTFTNVSSAFWQNLVKFQEWCDRGRYLVFHPGIVDLPPVLVGVMNILEEGQKEHRLWDLSRKSFRFVFEEV